MIDRLKGYLGKRLGGEVSIDNFKLLSGGASQDNYSLDLVVSSGSEKGSYELVMRTDKSGALLQSRSKEQEFKVIAEAHGRGVKTPRPFWFEQDAEVIGQPFYFLQRVDGNATGRFVVKDRSLKDQRIEIANDLAENMATIHTIRPGDGNSIDFLPEPPAAGSNALALEAINLSREYLDDMPGAYPAIELALNWLEENAPPTDEIVLVHGDFRTGNYMCNSEGLQGILDWELCHWGDRHEDLSWISMRCWRFGKINLPIGGISDRDSFYQAYEQKSGVKVDERKVLFWEIMGNVRWALGSAQQGNRHLSGADRGIEFASIGRISGEMEYEALSLIADAAGRN